MIMSPLGAIMMPALKMSTAQFGVVVSAYAFSAGISGLLAAGFADRYDPITTDLFPLHMRGRVVGYLQTAFASSQILGIPAGLYLSSVWGWHMPFMLIVGLATVALVIILKFLKPISEHLKYKSDKNAILHLWHNLKNPQYLVAFATMALMSIGGFMLMPFGSAFTVNNLQIPFNKLPVIYLVTGIAAIFIGPLVGRASDKFGKLKVFIFGAILTIIMVLIYTNLGVTPLYMVNIVLFCAIFSRIIPAQALMSAIPSPENRGAFMAVTSSLQQISGSVASVIAGLIVVETASGKLDHFDTLGYILTGTVLVSMHLIYNISRQIEPRDKIKSF